MSVDMTEYEELLKELTATLQEYEESENLSLPDKSTRAICELYAELIKNKQHLHEVVPEPIRIPRVIRSRRIVPFKVVERYSEFSVKCGGLYFTSEVYLLPMDRLVMATKKDPIIDAVVNPENYGLPSDHLVMYSTRRRVSNNLAVALPSNTWLSEYLTTASHYEYPVLS